jgi:hypothetical protein
MWGGMERWKVVSKKAIDFALGRRERQAEMTERAAPLCLRAVRRSEEVMKCDVCTMVPGCSAPRCGDTIGLI